MIKRILLVLLALFCVVALAAGLSLRSTIKSVPRLFRSNAELKAQGYYMGEFEFKMVASQYYLHEGRYLEAYRTLQRIDEEMRSKRGLVRLQENATPEQQMAFLLDRQDPATGAFMDSRYPVFTYFAPTCNVIDALMGLSRETGRPLQLKHPLRFLDDFRTPDQLRAYLDSLLYLDDLSARLPGPGPYGPGVSELAAFAELEEAGVCRFSDEWETALRRWFYETQDSGTGFWGARIGTADRWRQKADINSTFHILKLVLDERGNHQSQRFPLRYGGTLARGILSSMDVPIPEDTAEQHDWGLKQYQGAKILTQFLWPHLAEPDRAEARRKFRSMLVQSCRLYRPSEGGFAYYTSDPKADVDGTGLAMGVLRVVGVLPGTWERERLWGKGTEATLTPIRMVLQHWEQASLPTAGAVQSFRVYRDRLPSDNTYEDVNLVQIIYPDGAQGCDVMDLRQGLGRYLGAAGPIFGNWESKKSLQDLPLDLDREIRTIPVTRRAFDLAKIAGDHPASKRFYVVGYDIVQVPVLSLVFVRK
jgi:hypothetical protein